MNERNRVIPFREFYDCLQREYIVANLRSKIYERQKDRDYYIYREMEGKERTIKAIASRNNLPSIFTDSGLKKRFESEIYNEWGLPNFIYRSDSDRANRRPKDILAYFHKGVEVSVKSSSGEIVKGVVVWTDLEKQSSYVLVGKEKILVPFINMARMYF